MPRDSRVNDQTQSKANVAKDSKSTAPCQCQNARTERGICPACGTVAPVENPLLATSGQSLDRSTRSDMESRFGADFRSVRIHTDASARQSARSMGARSFTMGRDIAFASGQFSTDTSNGRQLLAHELAHVVQQGAEQTSGKSNVETPRLEAEARRASRSIENGQSVGTLSPSPLGIARETDPPRAGGSGTGLRGGDRGAISETVVALHNSIPVESRGRKTVAVGLVEVDGQRTLVYTVSDNWTHPNLRKKATQLGVTRWEATARTASRKDPRGRIESSHHAEQLLMEAAVTNNAKVIAVAPSRAFCKGGQCRVVVESEGATAIDPKKKVKKRPTKKKSKPQKKTTAKKPTDSPAGKKSFTPGRPTYPDLRSGRPNSTIRGRNRGRFRPRGAGLAEFLPDAMNALQDLTIRHAVAGRMLSKWKGLEQVRRDHPDHVIVWVVSLREWEQPDPAGQVARGVNYVTFAHGKTKEEAVGKLGNSLREIPPKGWIEVGPFYGWIEPTQSLDEAKDYVESQELCFIATACYGSPMNPNVELLRNFREAVLRRNALGRAFIASYYFASPPVARFLGRHRAARAMVRTILLVPLVFAVQSTASRWRKPSQVESSAICRGHRL
ncbi:MAG: DUF4157 domain-containing protein [Planctomycetota bacterium]